MMSDLSAIGPRRIQPRIAVESLCSEYSELGERHGIVVDVSPDGLRVQRALGGVRSRRVQLEFELPELDEIIWAQGEICFDQVWQLPPTMKGGLSGLVRTSGIQIVSSARHHRHLLHDYVIEMRRRKHLEETDWFYRCSRYD